MCWIEDLALDELLAAGRAVRSRAGQEIPAWGEPSSEPTVPVTIFGLPPPLMAATRFAGAAWPAAALQTALNDALTAARKAVHAKGANGLTDPGAACRHEDAAAGYRIPGRLRALVEARDQYCRYPICRRPAAQCDLDHTVPYDRGVSPAGAISPERCCIRRYAC